MSDQPAPSTPAAAPQASAERSSAQPPRPPKPVRPPKSPKSRRGGALAVLALLLALLALACVAFGGWQWWQGRHARQVANANVVHKLNALQQSVAAEKRQREMQAQARQALQATNRVLRQQVAGLSGRVDSLEQAVASLARHNRHGREAMALDQAAMLLRMGQQRYALFHDAAGAIKALTLADQTLAAVDDPDLVDVRQALAAERKALVATHPSSRADDLVALAHLRAAITTLPLKPLNDTAKPARQGFWQRVWHALSTAVVVRRDNGSIQSLADTRLTRQLVALDVAQAQAARLAWHPDASHAALERVAKALDTAFDTHDAGVRKARAEVARLLAEKPASALPHLGRALKELQGVRGVRDAVSPDTSPVPSTPVTAPAHPVSAGHAGAPV